MSSEFDNSRCHLRNILALALLVIAFFLEDPFESAVYRPFAGLMDLHMITRNGEMAPMPYGILMVVRLVWNVILWVSVAAVLRYPPSGFPL